MESAKGGTGPRHEAGMQTSGSFPDEIRLRDRILAGDRDSAEGFFRHHMGALYEFVHYRVGGNRAQAEDVVQDTFMTALQRLGAFDGRSTLHAWLCGIAKNKIRAQRRKARPASIEDLLAEADPEIDAILAAVDREPLPDWVLERAETNELVGATLSSLPPDYRELLVGKYLDGLSTAELAARRGNSEKAAESKLTRARLAFGRIFSLLAKKRGGLA